MIIIGIDPGLTGAVAAVYVAQRRDADVPAVYDMPCRELEGKSFVKRAVNLDALTTLIRSYQDLNALAFIEKVNAFPGQGVSSMFSLGMSYYGAAGVCAGLGVPVQYVPPQEWKRHFGLDRDKSKSLALARSLFPNCVLDKEKHHGRAEALLIARYAQEKLI